MATGRQYDKIINGDVIISQPTADTFSITFNVVNQVIFYQIWSDSDPALNNNRLIFNSTSDELVRIFNSLQPFQPTVILDTTINKYAFILTGMTINNGQMIWNATINGLVDKSPDVVVLTPGVFQKVSFYLSAGNKIPFPATPDWVATGGVSGLVNGMVVYYYNKGTNAWSSTIYQNANQDYIVSNTIAYGNYDGANQWVIPAYLYFFKPDGTYLPVFTFDGTTIRPIDAPIFQQINGVPSSITFDYSTNYWMFVGFFSKGPSNGYFYDGANWGVITSTTFNTLYPAGKSYPNAVVSDGNNNWVVVGNGNPIIYCSGNPNGTWTTSNVPFIPANVTMNGVESNGKMFVAYGWDNFNFVPVIVYSSDKGATWTEAKIPYEFKYNREVFYFSNSLTWNTKQWVLTYYGSPALSNPLGSADGMTWDYILPSFNPQSRSSTINGNLNISANSQSNLGIYLSESRQFQILDNSLNVLSSIDIPTSQVISASASNSILPIKQ